MSQASNFHTVYRHHALEYDALVRAEDHAGNLRRELGSIVGTGHALGVEVGAGTGRLTQMVASHSRSLCASDASSQMLGLAAKRLRDEGIHNVELVVADARAVPLRSGMADFALAGWIVGHFVDWSGAEWKADASAAIAEMRRVLHADGSIVLVESLGTGTDDCAPPTPGHGAYYDWLERSQGFVRVAVRTDYEFALRVEAEALTRTFFGDAMVARLEGDGPTRLLEWTGIWVSRH